jgi:hypothetical protein
MGAVQTQSNQNLKCKGQSSCSTSTKNINAHQVSSIGRPSCQLALATLYATSNYNVFQATRLSRGTDHGFARVLIHTYRLQ